MCAVEPDTGHHVNQMPPLEKHSAKLGELEF
jgi:hypothetical protein